MIELLLATRNKGKALEFAQALGCEFQVRDLTGTDMPPIAETGSTFEENAVLKALAVAKWVVAPSPRLQRCSTAGTGCEGLVVADDSGLVVDSLGGAPGVYSARYAGPNATDEENVAKLLRELKRLDLPSGGEPRSAGSAEGGTRSPQRVASSGGAAAINLTSPSERSIHLPAARFVCVLALAQNGKLLKTFRGEMEGTIVDAPRGSNGFGYDPVFQPNGFAETTAELSPQVKNRISHRGYAIAQLREYLRTI